MMNLFERLRRLVGNEPRDGDRREQGPRRRHPSHVGRSSSKEIEEAPPARAGELAGHAVERVDT